MFGGLSFLMLCCYVTIVSLRAKLINFKAISFISQGDYLTKSGLRLLVQETAKAVHWPPFELSMLSRNFPEAEAGQIWFGVIVGAARK
jgi:hypothetical protein